MGNIGYYISIFIRRFPYFLILATMVSALSIAVAMTLPPAYVSQMRLVMEAPQIPDSLAPSTVETSAREQMQLVEQRLLTRPVLLDIANRLEIFPDQDQMSPDEIVGSMRSRTNIRSTAGRNEATTMTISFEAPTAKNAAAVLNEYLNKIQEEDVEYRKSRATQTLEFFEQEVDRLGGELDQRSAGILKFETENSDALPQSLPFRQSQQAGLQESLEEIGRQISVLRTQRDRLMEIFQQTGQVGGTDGPERTPNEAQLNELRTELENNLAVLSETNPRIRLLRARVEKLEKIVAAEIAALPSEPEETTGNSALDVQLAQIDTELEALNAQKTSLEARLETVTASIERTPAVSIALDELRRDYNNIQSQYNTAIERLARASTGERIEVLSRGQRIAVVEQPAVPNRPTRPNRLMIAGGGTGFGIALGLGLILLLELLNRTARRPEDLIARLEVWPIATIPYVRTRTEMVVQRGRKLLLILAILLVIPAGVWAIHVYYQPLDLIAERVMTKLGMRW